MFEVQYDFEGRRIKKIGEGGTIQYVHDQTSTFLEYDELGRQLAKYDYGADRLISQTRGTATPITQFYSFDALRSVTNLSDSTGNVDASYHLDAWGNFRFPDELDQNPQRFAYTGHEFDRETNLYNAKARYYDATVGKFINQDSFLGNVDNPPTIHRFMYANANPNRFVDPTGNFSLEGFARGAFNVVAEPFRQAADVVVAAGARIQGIDSEDVQLNSMLGRHQQARINEGQSGLWDLRRILRQDMLPTTSK